MAAPVPPHIVAIRDTICAHLRNNHWTHDSEAIARAMPDQRRHIPNGATHCHNQHRSLLHHGNITALLACYGDNGHLITHRLGTLDIHLHCQALHIAGYLQKYPADNTGPDRWLFIEPAYAAGHRRIELDEQAEFAALAQLAGDPGPQR